MKELTVSPEAAKARKKRLKEVEGGRRAIYSVAWKLSEDDVLALGQFIEKYGMYGLVETVLPERRNVPRLKFDYSHYEAKPYIHVERCNLMQEAKRYVIRIDMDGEGALPFRIYRRFEVPSNMWMEEFGPLVIELMGWNNSHLHSFTKDGKEYVCQWQYEDYLEQKITEEDEENSYNTMTVSEFLSNPGDQIEFMYDYGDSWQHVLTLEEVTDYEPESAHPSLILDGEYHCPPDDCGGVYGYAELLKIIADPKHPEYKEYKQWLPRGFKSDVFDVDKQNKKLKKLGF